MKARHWSTATPRRSPAGSVLGALRTSPPRGRSGCSRGGRAASTRSLDTPRLIAASLLRRASAATTCSSTWIGWRTGPRSRRVPHTRARAVSLPPLMMTTAPSRGLSRVPGPPESRTARPQGGGRPRGRQPPAAGMGLRSLIAATQPAMATKVGCGALGRTPFWATLATPRARPLTSSRPLQGTATRPPPITGMMARASRQRRAPSSRPPPAPTPSARGSSLGHA